MASFPKSGLRSLARRAATAFAVGAAGMATAQLVYKDRRLDPEFRALFSLPVAAAAAKKGVEAGHIIPGLPEYTLEEVAAHNKVPKKGKDAKGAPRVWTTYKGGVYDITDFLDGHPGGRNRIVLSAGGSIDPFWRQFKIHDQDAVRTILEGMRIGNVKGYVAKKEDESDSAAWANEPKRHPALVKKSTQPFNAETPDEALTDTAVVSNELWFVRNHMPVPMLDINKHCVVVEGEGTKTACFSVADLKRQFTSHSITTTIQCGGNRRTEAIEATAEGRTGAGKGAKVAGLEWTNGAIGTAEWRGVWLRDVLAHQGLDVSALPPGQQFHVRLAGADRDPGGNFEVSIPLEMAMSPDRDVLLAYEMNGEPIPRDHGAPIRSVIPGVIGVRNCKWLAGVNVHRQESQSDWQQRDYKQVPPWAAGSDLSEHGPSWGSIYDMPVTSAITEATRVDDDTVTVKGFAYVGGGRGVERVDVSVDGGNTFSKTATLSDGGIIQPRGKRWAWQHFTAEVMSKVADGAETADLPVCVRAVTRTNDIQPAVAPYNFRGLMYNGYSCVKV